MEYDTLQYSIEQLVTSCCHLKTWPPPIITSSMLQKWLFGWYHLNIWTDSILTMLSVHENKIILLHSLGKLSYPCNCELKYLHKYPRFNKIIWIFKLLLLSRPETCSKRHFWWSHLKIWTGPIISTWNFCKKANLIISFENLNCPNYHDLKILPKKTVLMMSLENLKWSYYLEQKFLQKSQFWLYHLKIWIDSKK